VVARMKYESVSKKMAKELSCAGEGVKIMAQCESLAAEERRRNKMRNSSKLIKAKIMMSEKAKRK